MSDDPKLQPWMHDVPAAIVATKRMLRERVTDRTARFARMTDWLRGEVAAIRSEQAHGGAVPQIAYADVAAGRVSDADKARIRRRGCVVVRGVYDRAQASAWNEAIGVYIDRNDYLTRARAKAGLDRYFSNLASDRPQIFGLYWSLPQMQARQAETSARTRAFLNHLWRFDDPATGTRVFDADRECTYADRVRRRQPGDKTLGLSPHADAGSVERWIDASYQKIYGPALTGEITDYDPFDARGRTATHEIPSPAVASVFRTFQGWTALTAQGPGDGTLQLVPIAAGMAWLVARALQDDVPENDLCGAQPGRAMPANRQWHAPLLDGLVPIPHVEPGDTVWWHADVIHAVEDHHTGSGYSNVIYIGAAPVCAKNTAFLPGQAQAFLAGRSSPDFAAEDYEVDFKGRARLEDLTELGKRQMGLTAW